MVDDHRSVTDTSRYLCGVLCQPYDVSACSAPPSVFFSTPTLQDRMSRDGERRRCQTLMAKHSPLRVNTGIVRISEGQGRLDIYTRSGTRVLREAEGDIPRF